MITQLRKQSTILIFCYSYFLLKKVKDASKKIESSFLNQFKHLVCERKLDAVFFGFYSLLEFSLLILYSLLKRFKTTCFLFYFLRLSLVIFDFFYVWQMLWILFYIIICLKALSSIWILFSNFWFLKSKICHLIRFYLSSYLFKCVSVCLYQIQLRIGFFFFLFFFKINIYTFIIFLF